MINKVEDQSVEVVAKPNRELLRMVHFFVLAFVLYATAIALAESGITYFPQVQTILWKLGHITTGAFLGYWIDRHAFRNRLGDESAPLLHIRRAIIIVGVVLAVSMGM